MLQKYILFLKKHPLITAAIAVAYSLVCLNVLRAHTFLSAMLLRSLLCGSAAFFLYQISGDKTLASSYNSTGYVIKVAAGFWVFALPLGIFSLVMTSGSDYPVWDDPVIQMVLLFLMFLFVGLFEEMTFRAVINDAIIYRFRDKKYVFILSAVVSSLVFGAAHVIGYEISSPLGWAQAAGKIIDAGIFGLGLLFLYWKTRNIWACGVVHGVYDFLISMGAGIYDTSFFQHGSYILSDEYAVPTILTYAAASLINLFILWRIWKKIGKSIDYDDIRKNW